MQSSNDNISFISSFKLIKSAKILSANNRNVVFSIDSYSKNYSDSNYFKQYYQSYCSFSFENLEYTTHNTFSLPEPQKGSLKSTSPSGLFNFNGFTNNCNGKTTYHVEVSTKEGIVLFNQNVDHGPFCCDEIYFGRLCWDEDGMQLLYQADQKKDNNEEFKFEQSFGENFSSTFSPLVFLLNFSALQKRGLYPLNLDHSVYPSNPSFYMGSILYVGLEKLSFKYGISYCYNRPSALYKYFFEDDLNSKISSFDGFSVRSLRYLKEKNCMRFLVSRFGGSHFGSTDIYELYEGWDVKKISSNHWMEKLENNPLIYSYWSKSRKLFLWEGKEDICSSLFLEYPYDSFKILDHNSEQILIERSNPTETPKVLVLHERSFRKSLSLNSPLPFGGTVEQICLRMNSECTLITPSSSIKGLIMIPHGGPNSNITTEFKTMVSLFLMESFAVATVNYVGSIGYSIEAIGALEESLGESECKDMLLAFKKCKEVLKELQNVYICGGSHGGYIGAMMSCKHGSLFKGVILRNPVINMAGMAMASDICDWPLGQSGGCKNNSTYDIRKPIPVKEDDLIRINRQSPSFYLEMADFVPPTLILLGDLDLRVPPFQGKMWHTWLLSRGFDSSLHIFPDTGHSLDSVISDKCSLQLIMNFLKNK